MGEAVRQALAAGDCRPRDLAPAGLPRITESLLTLTPAEREFADSYLLSEKTPGVDSGASDISTGGIWQLTSRIRRKFLGFFGR